MKRFFFNATSRKCEEFRFGGCEGNANRFDSEEECQDYCGCKLARKNIWTYGERQSCLVIHIEMDCSRLDHVKGHGQCEC